MNKMKKLLSVLLAVIMALSCMSVIASAEITQYQDVSELEALDAYSPYGTVTRLSTEERMSIVYDWLDMTLAKANINMGTVIDLLGITITINLTSVDNICLSIDSFKNSTSGFMWAIAKGLLGVLGELSFDTWNTGIDRAGDSSLTLVSELLDLLQANRGVVKTIISTGELDLGLVTAFLKGLDLSAVTNILGDIPGLVKGLIFPLFERWDHTLDEVNALDNAIKGDGQVIDILEYIINAYFKSPMSMTTVKADANGNMTSDHELPSGDTHRRKFVVSADKKTITVYQYQTQVDVDKNKLDDIEEVGYLELDKYVLVPEVTNPDGTPAEKTDYVYACLLLDANGNPEVDENGKQVYGQALKFYKPGSYWLPEFAEKLIAGTETFSIKNETGANLLYKMIPYVFDTMVPVVANGSLKKILAEFFGTTFKYVGEVGSAEVAALADASNTFFTEPQGEYIWEWSNYAVINGTHYYRFEDQIFVGDTSKANEYMNIINWDYEITSDILTKYIPANTNSNSAAGYSKILHGINDFLIDLATEVANLDVLNVSFTKGDNTNLAENLRKAAKAVLSYHPEHIFGSGYADPDHYYNLIISDNKDEVLVGVAALAVDGLAPQMILPGAVNLKAQGVKVGAIGAAMLRELATQLLPHYNYDALIYSDYNTKTFLAGKDNSYWLDVILTMGVDIGMKYLHNLADMNEDSTAWANLGYGDSMTASKVYTTSSFNQNPKAWEDKVDYIVDWALTQTKDGSQLTWNMATLVGGYVTDAGYTIDLATAQDPWVKIDAILDNILFFDQFTSETNLETGLRGTIEDLLNLNLGAILGTASDPAILDVPSSSRLVSESLLSALSLEVRDLINGLFNKIGGGFYFIPTSITTIDQLLTTSNLATIVEALLNALPTAYANGLMDTILPFFNMFLGWSTDAQKYATPSIMMGSEYVYAESTATTATTTINISNMSSGMLLKHRANIKSDDTFKSTVDKPYTLKVTNVESSVAGTTFDKTSADVAPYGTATVTATVPYAGQDMVVRFVITYRFTGKDGQDVGSEMKLVIYQLFTSRKPESSTVGEIKDGTADSYSVYVSAYESYVYTKDLYSAVTGQKGTISYAKPVISAPDRVRISHAITSTAMASNAAQYFAHVYTESTGKNPGPLEALGWTIYFGGEEKVDGKPNGTSGGLYTANSGVTADTEFPLGLYDMGTIQMHTYKQNNDCGTYKDSGNGRDVNWTYKFYLYEDYDVDASVKEYTDKMLLADGFAESAQDEFATYEAALMNAVKLAQYPIYCAYNDDIRPQIEAAVEALETAYEALMEADKNAQASADAVGLAELEAALAADDGDGEVEINFQDYDLFEYFEYQDYRTALRNLAKTFYAPAVLDQYYILGSGISYDELSNDVIPGAANETIRTAITASMTERDEAEILASQKAHDEFKVPQVDELYMDDQIARLEYYRQFILPIAADLTFLNKEISYADANFPASVEDNYTADSWANYIEKYNAAKEITDSDIPSKVFKAKYNLMVAMKNLLLKSESAIEQGATADLLANIEIANSILAMDLSEIKLSQVAIDKGLTVEEALGHLIYGLGYKYTGRDGIEYDLYVDSALEYTENDRPNVSTNTAKIDACNDNLAACIAYFDIAVAAPELGAVDGTTGVVGETTDVDGVATGYIYGVAVGGADNQAYLDTYFKLEDESAGYTKKVASNLTGGSINGTGAKLEVYNNSDVKVAEYTLVVFGDVNGDAAADALDLSIVTLYTQNAGAMDELPKYAADVNGDNATDALDISNVTLYTQNAGSLTVNPRA